MISNDKWRPRVERYPSGSPAIDTLQRKLTFATHANLESNNSARVLATVQQFKNTDTYEEQLMNAQSYAFLYGHSTDYILDP